MTSRHQRPWRQTALPEHAWQATHPRDRAGNRDEQDSAAGGAQRRLLTTSDGTRVRARIRLTRKGGRRVYAYLAWTEAGTRRERYVCQVEGTTRLANLTEAWKHVHATGLLQPASSSPTVLTVTPTAAPRTPT